MAPRRPWSSLPEELLELIFKRPTMDSADLLRCRYVCVSWRSIIKKLFGKEFLVPLLPPLLFFPNKTSSSGKPCSNLHTDFYRLGFPFTHEGRFFMYSSRGWLLSSASDKFSSHLQLLNPFSGAIIKLSKPPREFDFPFRFILSGSPSSESCIILLFDRYRSKFVFCNPGNPWSDQIYDILAGNRHEDLIFYKNHFYVIRDCGALDRFMLDSYYNPYLSILTNISPVGAMTNRRYLVESLCGTLLMVLRYMHWEKVRLDTCSYKTTMFQVFWLDWSKNEWRKMENLGDQALFLAHNDSRIVSAQNPTMYERNCIYFVDDTMEGYCKSRGADFGVFDMKKKTVKQFCSVPFNRWFKPDI